jgi:hypothetical protein
MVNNFLNDFVIRNPDAIGTKNPQKIAVRDDVEVLQVHPKSTHWLYPVAFHGKYLSCAFLAAISASNSASSSGVM